jgi:hypothetical protein
VIPGSSDSAALETVRRLLLVILVIGMVGTAVELVLLDHYEDTGQLIPLTLLGLGLGAVSWQAATDRPWSLRALQIVMVLFVGSGLLGVLMHYQANVEFQREVDPSVQGLALFRKVLQAKAPPALAPGVMVQLGLIGLVYTWRPARFPKWMWRPARSLK